MNLEEIIKSLERHKDKMTSEQLENLEAVKNRVVDENTK